MRKQFDLSDEAISVIRSVQEQHGFKSERLAVEYILQNFDTREADEKIADAVVKKLDTDYIQRDRLKWSTQTAEQNSIILLDCLNTLLFSMNIQDIVPVDSAPSPVIRNSKTRIKERIAWFKQQSDERKAKAGKAPAGGD